MKSWKNNWMHLSTFLKAFNRHVHYKKKYLQGNRKPFCFLENLWKVSIQRTRLRKVFEENKSSYRNQIIFCFLLLFKTKRPYVGRLNEKDITENKNFWKAVKPLSSLWINLLKKVTLVESNKILPEDEKVVRTLNDFLSNIVKDLLKIFAYISQNVRFMTCLTKILENILFNN